MNFYMIVLLFVCIFGLSTDQADLLKKLLYICIFVFLDAIASPSSYPCGSVSGSVIDSFRFPIFISHC